jgi:hypothetical protein
MTQNQRELAETVFERNERREAEINNAMKQEHARREAAVKNMYRLRALRLARMQNQITTLKRRDETVASIRCERR